MVYYFIKYVFYLPLRFIFFRAKVFNKDRYKKGKMGFVTVFNHFSFLDIPIVAFYSRRRILFVAKKELKKNLFIRFMGFLLGIIYINREGADIKALKNIIQTLKKDKVIGIAPEGTRNKQNTEIQPLKEGVSYICSRSNNCYVIPYILLQKPKLFRKSFINVGEPIKLFDNNEKHKKDELEKATEKLFCHMKECKRELEVCYFNYKNRKAIKKGKIEAKKL